MIGFDASRTLSDLFKTNVRPVYFDSDESDICLAQISRMNANAAWLQRHPNPRFTIQENCGRLGSDEYNIGLGDRRANRIKELLVKEGVDPSRISVISY